MPLLPRLSSTLLSLALVTGALPLLSAASELERDQHYQAVKSLIEEGFRQSAQRQLEDFAKANYPNSTWHQKGLAYYLAETFKDGGSEKVKAALTERYNTLKGEIDANRDKPGISEVAVTSGDPRRVLRLAKEIGKVINPDLPPPAVPMNAERIAGVSRAAAAIKTIIETEWPNALARVKAHAEEEKLWWDLDPTDKRFEAIGTKAINLRLEIIKILYTAHQALREIVTRGPEFGVDPLPTKNFLLTFLKSNKDILTAWASDFGSYNLYLSLYTNTLLGEGLRLGVPGTREDDIENGFMTIIDTPVESRDVKAKAQIDTVKLLSWEALLRWRLDIGTDKSRDRGIQHFLDLKTRSEDPETRLALLNNPDTYKAQVAGQIWLLAARIYEAKGEKSKSSKLLTELRGARNAMSGNAAAWMSRRAPGQSNTWGKQPSAESPSTAIALGKAFIQEGLGAGPKQQRAFFLDAAIGLRDGVLGLSSAAYANEFVDNAPQVYRFYALALNKLDMPYHAALVSNEGLKAIKARISERENPWKTKTGEWTQSGLNVKKLAEDAIYYVQVIGALAKSNATTRLSSETLEIAKKIDPNLSNKNLEWADIVRDFSDGNHDQAKTKAVAYAGKYPDDYYKAFDLITTCRIALYEKAVQAKDDKKAAELLKEILDKTANVEKVVAELLLKPDLPVDERKKLQKALATCQAARILVRLKDKSYIAVLEQLGQAYWKNPPADPELVARMLKYLAQATYEHQKAVVQDKARVSDSKLLISSWPTIAAAGEAFTRQAKRYAAAGDGTQLRNGYQMMTAAFAMLSNQAEQLADKAVKDEAEKLAPIVDAAKRFYADFAESTMNDKTPPGQLLAAADTLHEIGERVRAARLYEIFKKSLDGVPEIRSYLENPEAVVKEYAQVLTTRVELRKMWEEAGGIADLLVDPTDFLATDYINPKYDGKRGVKRDYRKASIKLAAFRKLLDEQKSFLVGDAYKTASDKLNQFTELVRNLARFISVNTNLAQHYSESGEATKAIKLYEDLYLYYDPLNPDYASGFVEGVLAAIRDGTQNIEKKSIENARTIATTVAREASGNPALRDTFWRSTIQSLELSMRLGEGKGVETVLAHNDRNRSTPRDDLLLPPQPGDDKRVTRARNVAAVDLAQRYLALYEKVPGLKPTFKVDWAEGAGQKIPYFSDVDAPAFISRVEKDADDEERIVVVTADAPPAFAPAPAPGAAAPAPAAPAPAAPAPAAPAPAAPAATVPPAATTAPAAVSK